ncbi:hypothetical protein ACWGLF_43525 [Streptomyces puniciscabiei]
MNAASCETRLLSLLVLALGGAGSLGGSVADTMRLVDHDVHSAVIAGTGRWVAEAASRDVLTALTTFLAPYRDQARNTPPRATAAPGT